MSTSFLIWTAVIMLTVGLSLGTAIKLWSYGVHDLTLVISPVIAISLFLILPVVAFNTMVFHPEKFDKTNKNKRKYSEMSLFVRIWKAVIVAIRVVEIYPLCVGIGAYMISAVQERGRLRRLSTNGSSELLVNTILEFALA